MLTRRHLLAGAATLATVAISLRGHAFAAAGSFEISMTDDQWREKLPPDRFAVLREAATERPFTSPLLEEHRRGTFVCAGCDLPLFSSETKFESGTGWPSF